MVVVHRKPRSAPATRALAPGVQTLPWQDFVAGL